MPPSALLCINQYSFHVTFSSRSLTPVLSLVTSGNRLTGPARVSLRVLARIMLASSFDQPGGPPLQQLQPGAPRIHDLAREQWSSSTSPRSATLMHIYITSTSRSIQFLSIRRCTLRSVFKPRNAQTPHPLLSRAGMVVHAPEERPRRVLELHLAPIRGKVSRVRRWWRGVHRGRSQRAIHLVRLRQRLDAMRQQ